MGLARKLFVRMWAMDRDRKDWNGPAAMKPDRRGGTKAVIEVEEAEAEA